MTDLNSGNYASSSGNGIHHMTDELQSDYFDSPVPEKRKRTKALIPIPEAPKTGIPAYDEVKEQKHAVETALANGSAAQKRKAAGELSALDKQEALLVQRFGDRLESNDDLKEALHLALAAKDSEIATLKQLIAAKDAEIATLKQFLDPARRR